jgi:LysM repeat protein
MQSPSNHIIYRCPSCSSRISINDTICSVCGVELTPSTSTVENKTQDQPIGAKSPAPTPVKRPREPIAPPPAKPRETQVAEKSKESPKTPWVRRENRPLNQRLPWGVIGLGTLIIGLMLGALALIRSASTPTTVITPVITFATSAVTLVTQPTRTSAQTTVPTVAPTNPPPPTIAPTTLPTVAPTPIPTSAPATTITQTQAIPAQGASRTITQTAQQPAAGIVVVDYVVQPNDTCSSLAERYRATVSAIQEYNKLSGNCIIATGARIKIPFNSRFPGTTVNPADVPVSNIVYVVQPNDTCEGIANKFKLTMAILLRANNLSDNCLIISGTRLQIPTSPSSAVAANQPVTPTQTPPTATPQTRASITVPVISSPTDRAIFTGTTGVVLEWQATGQLANDQWYVVALQPVDGVNPFIFETKNTAIRIVDTAILDGAAERTFVANIQVRRVLSTRPNGEHVYENISPPSESRRVIWRR